MKIWRKPHFWSPFQNFDTPEVEDCELGIDSSRNSNFSPQLQVWFFSSSFILKITIFKAILFWRSLFVCRFRNYLVRKGSKSLQFWLTSVFELKFLFITNPDSFSRGFTKQRRKNPSLQFLPQNPASSKNRKVQTNLTDFVYRFFELQIWFLPSRSQSKTLQLCRTIWLKTLGNSFGLILASKFW